MNVIPILQMRKITDREVILLAKGHNALEMEREVSQYLFHNNTDNKPLPLASMLCGLKNICIASKKKSLIVGNEIVARR